MANQFKIQEAVTFSQQTPPESFRLMDVTIQVIPAAYEHGMVIATNGIVDQEIASDVNIFVLDCATGVTLKIGNTTSPPMTNVTHFCYQGAKTDFYVSNPGTEDIPVSFATASI